MLVLRIGALDPHRQQGFLDLAGERDLVGQEEVLGDLLGDGGGALRTTVGTVILREQHRGARHAGEVDAAMLVEILVFGGKERVDDQLWNRLDRQIEPAFPGVLAEQRAVGGMDARHHRRLVILQLRIIRQILGEMPDQPLPTPATPTRNTTVPAANKKPMNRTSKRIIEIPFQPLRRSTRRLPSRECPRLREPPLRAANNTGAGSQNRPIPPTPQ